MPTYTYECTKCGHRFEEFQSMTAKPLQRCPKCRGKLQRLIGAGAGLLFKGTGFYATDYRKAAEPGKKKAETHAEGASGGAAAGGDKPAPAATPAHKPEGRGAHEKARGKKARGD
jgi:putative FmdB family regulatory protein